MSDTDATTFDVSNAAAYSVLYSVLFVFSALAYASSGKFHKYLPKRFVQICFLEKTGPEIDGDNDAAGGTSTSDNTDGDVNLKIESADYFLSARNSSGVWAIGLSFFASGMGAWVLYGTTEMGANPALSWLGVLGYSSASAFPAILIGTLIGPVIRERYHERAFCTTDFGRERYGRIMQTVIACVSGFYMFIFIVAELTAISSIYATLTNNFRTWYGVGISLSVGLCTIMYTTIAGLPASIVTDKFQGVLMALLVLLILLAVTTSPENEITREEFAVASNWTIEGFQAAVTLVIAIASAELFNQGTWQRVWAAESIPSMRKGFALGSVLVFLLMMFFGIMGMIAYAKDPDAYNSGEKFAFLSFFDLLLPLKNGWHVVTLLLVTALAASTVDTLQNGISCVFAHDLIQFGWNPKLLSRILLVILNIPAIYLASKQYDVISLFLVADLVCATCVFPVFLGLQRSDYGILKAPTELGALFGCISGVAAVLINGIVNGTEGGLFQYFWLQNGGICSLCGTKTMVSFIVTPSVSCVMTYIFTYLDLMLRGERARQPTITVAFDTKNKSSANRQNKDIEEEEEGNDNQISADENDDADLDDKDAVNDNI